MRSLALPVLLLAGKARADEFATSPVRAGYAAADDRLLDSARRSAWEDAGFRWDLTYAVEGFITPQLKNEATLGGLFVVETELDLAKLVAAGMGPAHVAGFAIHGGGPTNELMDIHGVSGNTAEPDVRLFEAWYEQPIGAFTLRAGLLAADQEFIVADHSTTLLGATFGITSQFSYNVIGPVYPVATPGLSGRLELDDFLVVRAAVYDGTQENSHGIPTALGPDQLLIGEVELFTAIKLGAWRHNERGTALYMVLDGQLETHIGVFARAGVSPTETVHTYFDTGVRLGHGRVRPDDFFCIGIAFARTDDGDETIVEASYEAQVRWLTLQPDVQLVMMRDRTVGVFATRATVVF